MSPLLKTSSSPQTEAAMIQLLVVQSPFPSTPLCSATAMQPSLLASGPSQLLIPLALVVFLHFHTQARHLLCDCAQCDLNNAYACPHCSTASAPESPVLQMCVHVSILRLFSLRL